MDFDSQDFIENHTYSGKDLGLTKLENGWRFKLWAPTADSVSLNLFKDGKDSPLDKSIQMKKKSHGIWEASVNCNTGIYYTYSITTFEGCEEAVDPYATACSANGKRGMVVDLSSTNPKGFDKDKFVSCKSYEDAVIYEVHVRDFSNRIENSKFKGKYLAFTETGLRDKHGNPVGIDYLKKLGITHVQLQPVFDFGSGDESDCSSWFNWGYDPSNYNIPEGSYSTDPFDGRVRIVEFKKMVQALHKANIGVVMDVVYNHTFFVNSNLWKTVPYYYYRFSGWQQLSNGSGCGNETASERIMFRKYMIDSILYWQKEYHIDGFRFDLMALHDVDTIRQIERLVHLKNPSALIYGEPWSGGNTTLEYSRRAVPENLGEKTKVYFFNDVLRDSLKGSCFDVYDKGLINGNSSLPVLHRAIDGLLRTKAINYMSCHDNFTLFDKLKISCPEYSKEQIIKSNMFGSEILFISPGVPFFLSGEEFLRTKGGDGNSYMSPDSVNNLNWDSIGSDPDYRKLSLFYSKLIKMRKENPFIHTCKVSCEMVSDNLIKLTYSNGKQVKGIAFINPNEFNVKIDLPKNKEYLTVINGNSFKQTAIKNSAKLSPKSVMLLKA